MLKCHMFKLGVPNVKKGEMNKAKPMIIILMDNIVKLFLAIDRSNEAK